MQKPLDFSAALQIVIARLPGAASPGAASEPASAAFSVALGRIADMSCLIGQIKPPRIHRLTLRRDQFGINLGLIHR